MTEEACLKMKTIRLFTSGTLIRMSDVWMLEKQVSFKVLEHHWHVLFATTRDEFLWSNSLLHVRLADVLVGNNGPAKSTID